MIAPSIIISGGWEQYEYDTDELEYMDIVESNLIDYYNSSHESITNDDIFDCYDHHPYISWEEEYELFCEQQEE